MNFQGLEFDGVPTDPDLITDDNESVSSLVDEDVDFDYVYALFHFPQMVDGQVTVEEGEKLTLLDDSNSYWWLVQNLRDNQMGYIPADNIETAFGKLARVNRRKNLKLCRPEPEHMLRSRMPAVPKPNSRNVKFNDKLVTQVFISAPVSEDEYSDDDYDYDYEDEDIEDDNNAHSGHAQASQISADSQHQQHQEGDFDEDNEDYNYYYTSDAGNPNNGYNDHDNADHVRSSAPSSSSNSNTPTARRVSIAPMHMGQITGELMDDSESEAESELRTHGDSDYHGAQNVPDNRLSSGSNGITGLYTDKRDSSLLTHMVADPAEYYPANEESDEGDSLNGALHRLNDSHASVGPARCIIHITHVDSFNTTDATISVLPEETFRDVLRHSLSIFTIADDMEDDLLLHAHIKHREIIPLGNDMRVSQLFEILHQKCGVQISPDSNQIDPDLCTVVLADRTLPQGQLLLLSNSTENDPYVSMENGSRNILRTSIAASITEGISALASSASKGKSATQQPNSITSPSSSPRSSTVDTSVGKHNHTDDSPLSLSALTSNGVPQQDTEAQHREPQAETNTLVAEAPATSDEGLPDSRKVVQGLLRSIPPPKSRPPQSAINRAKRNTVQISALGSVVNSEYRVSRNDSQTRSALTRSASTRGPSSNNGSQQFTETVDQMFEAHAELSHQLANTPVEPALAVNNPSQALGQSASTLRPSSDTFTEEDRLSVDVSNGGSSGDRSGNNTNAEPMSPTFSSDTASIQQRDSEDGSTPASTADAPASTGSSGNGTGIVSVIALSHSSTHQPQKDNDGNMANNADFYVTRELAGTNIDGDMAANEHHNTVFTDGELSLDDWLVILRGWNDIHDMNSNTSVYQSILKDMESPELSSVAGHNDAVEYIRSHVTELESAKSDSQAAIDDILSVSQGVGRRLDTLERELDDIARVLVHAN
ncbi:hypothetical protein BX070DRAFT_223722 [Coemansia spiralis]|nr:hypothetical protein BX070DRAFT_223722 [Coemansia spiralis]